MPVKAFRNAKASTKENIIFDLFLDKLKERWEESNELIIVLSNFFYNNVEIDAMLIKRDAILIIDFKDYSGILNFSENGKWFITTKDGKTVEVKGGSGDKNPFMQIRWYKDKISKFFQDNNNSIFLNSDKKINHENIFGLVLFHDKTSLKDPLPPRVKNWFFIADIHNICQTIYQITNRDLNLNDEEILMIPSLLHLEEYTPSEIKIDPAPLVFAQQLYNSLKELKESLELANIVKSGFEKHKAKHEAFINFFYPVRPEIISQNLKKELAFPAKTQVLVKHVDEDLDNKLLGVMNCNSNTDNLLQKLANKKISKEYLNNIETVQKLIIELKRNQKDLNEDAFNSSFNKLIFNITQTFLYDRGLWLKSALFPIAKQIDIKPSVYPYLNTLFEILRTWFAEDMVQHWDSKPRVEHKKAAGFSLEWFENMSECFGEEKLNFSFLSKQDEWQPQIISEVFLPTKLSELFKKITGHVKTILSEEEYYSLFDLLKLRWIESEKVTLNDIYLLELRTNTIFHWESDFIFLSKAFTFPNEYFYEPTYISVLEALGNWGYGKINQEQILKKSFAMIPENLRNEVEEAIRLWKSPKPSYFKSGVNGERLYKLSNDLAIGKDERYNRRDISIELKTDPKTINDFLYKFKDEWNRNGTYKEYNVGSRNFMLLLKQFKNETRTENEPEISKKELPKTKKIVKELESINSSALSELEKLIGLNSVKKEIESLLNFVKIRKVKLERGLEVTPSTLHMVFTGNPGTGKTIVARLIGKIYYDLGLLSKGHCVEVSRTDLVAEYIGHTAQHTTKKFKEAIGGVLFIDEAYSLVQGSEKDFGREAVDTLNKLMEDFREEIVVIVAGYPSEMQKFLRTNKGLASRFPIKINFDDYSFQEKIEILEKFCKDNKHQLSIGAREKAYLLIEDFKFENNARSIRNLFELMIKNQSLRLNRIIGITDEDLVTFEAVDVPDNINNL